MIEIYPNLFIGNQIDYEHCVRFQPDDWFVVHACKDPYHRRALGYTGRGAPKDHPEYLIAERARKLILNLVDAPNPDYIPYEIIERAIEYIHEKMTENSKILVHCNQGESRAPSIGLLYLAKYTNLISSESLENAKKEFIEIYPNYNPSKGMQLFMQYNWQKLIL